MASDQPPETPPVDMVDAAAVDLLQDAVEDETGEDLAAIGIKV